MTARRDAKFPIDGIHPLLRRHYERRGMLAILHALLRRNSAIRVTEGEDDGRVHLEAPLDVHEIREPDEPVRPAQAFLVEAGVIGDLRKSDDGEREGVRCSIALGDLSAPIIGAIVYHRPSQSKGEVAGVVGGDRLAVRDVNGHAGPHPETWAYTDCEHSDGVWS